MIKAKDLKIGYSGKALFDAFDLTVPAGTFNIVVGANGSGKSTLLQTLAGVIRPVSGGVEISGNNLMSFSRRKLAQTVSLVFSDTTVAPGLKVSELVALGRYPHTGFLGRISANDRAIVNRAMRDVCIEDKGDRFLSDISDGERQKAMIARALAQQTPVLFLDEPTNFLDAASRIEIMGLLSDLVKLRGITIMVSSHDVSAAMPVADNVITVLPDDVIPVSLDSVSSSQAVNRLKKVFQGRCVSFDPDRNDFVRI